jgi:hypothetical protein
MVTTKKNKKRFVSTARLSRLQRKYCHCIMKVRRSLSKNRKNAEYPICYSTLRKSLKMDKTKKKRDAFQKKLKHTKINCVMNYDYDKYSLTDIQKLAKTKKISINYYKRGTPKQFKKSTLVQKITSNYLTKKYKKFKNK